MSLPAPASKGKTFGSTSLGKSPQGKAKAEPNWLRRQDIPFERWQVENCRAVRGEPRTDVGSKVMFAPTSDDELARVIRAHEMMHAKVSPTAEQFDKWIQREIASPTAMIVAEELRVNFLCQEAGIDVKTHLSDGSELATGEYMAKTGDWANAVAMCVGTAGTAGHKQFLNGIRRHNREWGEHLLKIGKRAVREMKRYHKRGYLASSITDPSNGMSPYGFSYTETLGEWIDRLADFPPPTGSGKKGKGKSSLGKSDKGTHTNEGEGEEGKGDKSGNPHDEITPSTEVGKVPKWGKLRIERVPMTRFSKGGIGRRRIATNVGRRPRRITRFLTDPQRRVFDRRVRGSGGMVIIDASGSMSFTTEQIAQIIEHAPGATVALYSQRGSRATNFWIVADKGRMVENVESVDYGHGNGVDYPAIVWGVENRERTNTPLVWVTDGGVCGENDSYHDMLAMQCITYARKHGYIVVPHVEEAITQLRNLASGGHARSEYPPMFRDAWKKNMGRIPLN